MKVTIEIESTYVDLVASLLKVQVGGTEEELKVFDAAVAKAKEEPQAITADGDLSLAIVAVVLQEAFEKKYQDDEDEDS